jgi:hypothetical protein
MFVVLNFGYSCGEQTNNVKVINFKILLDNFSTLKITLIDFSQKNLGLVTLIKDIIKWSGIGFGK